MNSQDDDDRAIEELLAGNPIDEGKLDFLNRALEPGEKASDAVDYEDIEDDDLAEEEADEAVPGAGAVGDWPQGGEAEGLAELDGMLQEGAPNEPGILDGGDGDLDDLFGDNSTFHDPPVPELNDTQVTASTMGISFEGEDAQLAGLSMPVLPVDEAQAHPDASTAPVSNGIDVERLMALNFDMVPAPPENPEEALATIWPKFRKDSILNFMDLIPQKRSRYMGKTPLRPPKPLPTTKLTFEIAPDQERSFRKSDRTAGGLDEDLEPSGIIKISEPESEDQSEGDLVELESDVEGEPVGGVSWNDLKMICEDWEGRLEEDNAQADAMETSVPTQDPDDLFGDDEIWTSDMKPPAAKVRVCLQSLYTDSDLTSIAETEDYPSKGHTCL